MNHSYNILFKAYVSIFYILFLSLFFFTISCNQKEIYPILQDNIIDDDSKIYITEITSTNSNAKYGETASITIDILFNDIVFVTGTPILILETGSVDTIASYIGGNNTNTLSFTYEVSSGENSLALDYSGSSALILDNGTIKDSDNKNVLLILPLPGTLNSLSGNKTLEIDTTPPARVSGFFADAGDSSATLSWTNPADPDFTGVMIRYRTDTFPISSADGNMLCTGDNCSSSMSVSGLTNGTTYYFTIFAFDCVDYGYENYSGGVTSTVTPYISPLFSDDFEDDDWSDWTILYGNHLRETTRPGANGTNYCFSQEGGSGYNSGVSQLISPINPTYISFHVKYTSYTEDHGSFILMDSSGKTVISILVNPDGDILYRDINHGGLSVIPDIWYHFEFQNINWANKTFNYYVNGSLISTSVDFLSSSTDIAEIQMYNYADVGAYWDEIVMY